MGRTIIQPIGPLEGEPVNGTVFGRPNGSVYVPSSNRIAADIPNLYIKNGTGGNIYSCNDAGSVKNISVVAESQDIASYIQTQISDDPDFGTYCYRSFNAGQFNLVNLSGIGTTNKFTVVDGTTYYIRAVLMASTNVPVAVSEVVQVTGVVPA